MDYEPPDQELRRFTRTSRAKGRIAERLIKAFAHGGDPRYLHLEVQGKKEAGFRRRVHVGNLRAEERFDAHIISLVILTDENLRWRPRRYVSGQIPRQRPAEEQEAAPAQDGKNRRRRYLDERSLHFLTVKLIDFRGREAELEALSNPVGLFVLAHLEAMRTRTDLVAREDVKLRLLRNLRLRKMDLEDARFWHTCLDWFLQLPAERELALRQQLELLDKEENVPYLSFIERHALEHGMETGLETGLAAMRTSVVGVLRARFPTVAFPESLLPTLESIKNLGQLGQAHELALKAASLEALLQDLSGSLPANGAAPGAP